MRSHRSETTAYAERFRQRLGRTLGVTVHKPDEAPSPAPQGASRTSTDGPATCFGALHEPRSAAHYIYMEEQPSERLIDQRIRNRIMEAVETLADGDEGVRREWPDEYFESFYNWVPHRGHGGMRPNSAISPDEEALLLEVSGILDDAWMPRRAT